MAIQPCYVEDSLRNHWSREGRIIKRLILKKEENQREINSNEIMGPFTMLDIGTELQLVERRKFWKQQLQLQQIFMTWETRHHLK